MKDLLNTQKTIYYEPKFKMRRNNFLFRSVRNSSELEDVYRLTYKCYLQQGYCEANKSEMLIHYPHLDASMETTIFIVESDEGEIVGTISTTRDNNESGLHVDADFLTESNLVRAEGVTLASSWRIAVDQEYRSQSQIARLLMDGSVAFWHSMDIDTCLMTFNPRHERFYHRYANCNTLSRKKSLNDLSNAPAVLMRWDANRCPLKKRLADVINTNKVRVH